MLWQHTKGCNEINHGLKHLLKGEVNLRSDRGRIWRMLYVAFELNETRLWKGVYRRRMCQLEPSLVELLVIPREQRLRQQRACCRLDWRSERFRINGELDCKTESRAAIEEWLGKELEDRMRRVDGPATSDATRQSRTLNVSCHNRHGSGMQSTCTGQLVALNLNAQKLRSRWGSNRGWGTQTRSAVAWLRASSVES